MSNEMNPWLASYYNTHGAGDAAAEEQEKIAELQLFCKLAADRGIDMSEWSNEDIENFYGQIFPEGIPKEAADEEAEEPEATEEDAPKPAAETPQEMAEEIDREKEAQAYHQEKVAFQEKFAEADLMGRVMAHAFTNELELIKQAMDKEAEEDEEEPKKDEGKDEKKDEEPKKDEKKDDEGDKKPMPAFFQKKEGSADARAEQFERLAMEQGIKVAAEAGYDKDLVTQRVGAVATLGLPESEKIASVQDTNMALHVRGLEYLEAAGVPVDWNEVFGK